MNNIVTTFGLEDIAIATMSATPGTEPTWLDVPAVTQAAFKQTVQEVEQNGDNKYLATHRFGQKGMITIKGTKASMAVFEALSGNIASSLAGGGGHLLFGTNSELVPPFVCVRTKVPCVKADGTAATVTAYFYKCQVATPFNNFPDSGYGKLGEIQFDLVVFKSPKNHKGETLPNSEEALGNFEMPAP